MILYQNFKQKIKKSYYVKSLHIGIKGSEEADKVAKQAIDMPGKITTRLTYT